MRRRIAILCILALALAARWACAQTLSDVGGAATPPASWQNSGDPRRGELAFELGRFDALRSKAPSQQVGLAYRPGTTVEGFRGEVGAMFSTDGTAFAHFAVTRDFPIGPLLIVRPSLGVGAYRHGGGKDLGYPIEFRSCLEVSVGVFDGGRVGLAVYHLSNAHLSPLNPGEESIVVVWTLPLPKAGVAAPRRSSGF